MSWFNTFTWNVKNFLRVENPNKVLDVMAQEYSHHNVLCREDGLVLYSLNSTSDKYELVLHRPFNETLHEAYSLCRCMDVETAQSKFLLYKDKVPRIVATCKDLYNSTQIQKICDLLSEHPTWNLAHLVTRLGHADCLIDPKVAKYINTEETLDGISPLQLAIQDQNMKMVQALLTHNASLDHFDHENNSVLHYAASTNKQIVNILCEKSKNTLNSRNASGRTPLHVACSSDKRECVHALLEAGADVNISVSERKTSLSTPGCVGSIQDFPKKLHGDDIKHGGTPLHWACSREVIEALVNKNCDINSLNFDQRTALHVMVLRNRLDCLVTLLTFKADCNIGDKDGNTPLHLAVQEGNEACVKALIVFGADMSYVNNQNHLPRHAISCDSAPGNKILYILHSVGAPRCPEDQEDCNTGCKYNETYFGVPPPPPLSPPSRNLLNSLLAINSHSKNTSSKEKGRLLCLDGGGIRGLVLVVMLMELEKHFGRPLYECFDWIAGTSTGGILTLAMASKLPLFDCLCLYFKLKDAVFCGKRPYPSENIETILKETFGDDTKMSSIIKPNILPQPILISDAKGDYIAGSQVSRYRVAFQLLITSTLVDRLPVDLHMFRNYSSPSEILGVEDEGPFEKFPYPSEFCVWQAARATGAAPAYFRSFGRYLDGGLIANNPTLDALTEIQEYNVALKSTGREKEIIPLTLVVSLGTGVLPVKQLREEVDVFRPDSLWDASKFVFGILTMSMILTDQATQADGRVVDRSRSWCSSLGVPFYRFSPQLSVDVALDEKSNEILTNMLWETKVYMHSKTEELKELAEIFKSLS